MKKSQQSSKKSAKKIAPEKLNDVSGGNTTPSQRLRDRIDPSILEIIERMHRRP